ncbi:MAG TPA: type II toxin-antitoxin system RelE/ParE family toxin [Thermoanaerobaculia bacterium]|nr:type II toxin-antitoxin system RelE/ParE family toxin [Thermoanaerobaculia bacterium]
MTGFQVDLTDEARSDLLYYAVLERKTIIAEIRAQLSHQPLAATKNRKPLRANPIASWELRIGRFRVFYEVDASSRTVRIIAVGAKERSLLFIRGREVRL